MRFTTLLVVSLAGVGLGAGLSPRDCSRNNCNRAVGGTRKPGHIATASADCSRILGSTVYEATVTVYSNVTRTIGKRQTIATPAVRKYKSCPLSPLACTDMSFTQLPMLLLPVMTWQSIAPLALAWAFWELAQLLLVL